MTTITQEIRRAIEQAGDGPVRLIDPQTCKTYVLLEADAYDRLQRPFDEEDRQPADGLFPGIREVFEDWDDPVMDIYNDLDPRR